MNARNVLYPSEDPGLVPIGFDPHVVYFTYGLHALHVYPQYFWAVPESVVLYEKVLTTSLATFSKLQAAQEGLVVYATMHAICEGAWSKRIGISREALQLSPAMVTGCANATWMTLQQRGYNASRLGLLSKPIIQELEQVCSETIFNQHGIMNLNHKAVKAFHQFKGQEAEAGRRVDWLHMLDHFHLTLGQCWATDTGDGVHFLPLVPAELYTVLLAVQQRYKKQ